MDAMLPAVHIPHRPLPLFLPCLVWAWIASPISLHAAVDWASYMPPVTPIQIPDTGFSKEFHVSPQGDDANNGLAPEKAGASGPFATIARARDEIRKLKQSGSLSKGAIAVNLRGGVYQLAESLSFTQEDSGSEGSPVVYRAYKDEKPRLAGGKVLKAPDFAPVTDPEMQKRLAPEASGKVVVADLKALGLRHTGPFPDVFRDGGGIFELFFNGNRMKLSRWPYDDYTTMKQVLVFGEKTGKTNVPGIFEYREEEPARWNPTNGVWLKGQWRVGWEDPAIKVGAISTTNHQITFATGISGGIGSKYHRKATPFGSGQESGARSTFRRRSVILASGRSISPPRSFTSGPRRPSTKPTSWFPSSSNL